MWKGLREAAILRIGLGMTLGVLLTVGQAHAQSTPGTKAGLYMERLADCIACHTRPGGTPFAGGREIITPYGSLSTPNITPDPDTGIGKWSDDQFYAALHDGIGHNGEYLYPVMPFPSYTKMTRHDVLAIKAYLFSLKPVYAPRAPSDMSFPFDIRESLVVWRELFFTPGTFKPNPQHSADWNRGAYLVQGPGHCGACHSPRNILGATETAHSLSGGRVQDWLAPNISSNPLTGLGDRSAADIVAFLKRGSQKAMGVAFGPMGEVVHDSLRYATDADLHAIAVYLKAGPDQPEPIPAEIASPAAFKLGRHLYLQNCAQCHQDKGRGIPGAVPNLADNAAITAPQPDDVIIAMLNGLQGTGGYGTMPSFAAALNDSNIADIANYVRGGWGNKAPANATPALVEKLRAAANVGVAGTESARGFDCPKVGSSIIPGTLATAAQAKLVSGGDGTDMSNRIGGLVDSIRSQQPGISDAALTSVINAAYCPLVANNQALGNRAKRVQLMQFNVQLQKALLAADAAPSQAKAVVSVPLAPNVLRQVQQAAAQHHMTPGQWIAHNLASQVAKPAK